MCHELNTWSVVHVYGHYWKTAQLLSVSYLVMEMIWIFNLTQIFLVICKCPDLDFVYLCKLNVTLRKRSIDYFVIESGVWYFLSGGIICYLPHSSSSYECYHLWLFSFISTCVISITKLYKLRQTFNSIRKFVKILKKLLTLNCKKNVSLLIINQAG